MFQQQTRDFAQCRFDVGPPSSTLAQRQIDIEQSLVFVRSTRRRVTDRVSRKEGHLGIILVNRVIQSSWSLNSSAYQMTCETYRSPRRNLSRRSVLVTYSAVQSQKAVTAHLNSKQLLPFGLARQYRYLLGD